MTNPAPGRPAIDDVLSRTDLTRLLDELTPPTDPKLHGRRWHCPHPDHDDHHPSVTVFTDRRGHQRWRCWSGDDTHRGDAIDLVATTRHLSTRDATDWLAHRAALHPAEPTRPQPRTDRPGTPPDPSLVSYVAACERLLWERAGLETLGWLRARGLPDDVVRANRVGADPGRAALPRSPGLPYGAGPAAVFPALGSDGAVRYAQARYLHPEQGHKYDNPSAVIARNPRLAWAVPRPRGRSDLLLVCEGIPDALTAATAGVRAVGVMGSSAIDADVAGELRGYAQREHVGIVAVPDDDDAGRAWSRRLADHLDGLHPPVAVLDLPTGAGDLNRWALQRTDWHAALPEPTPLLERQRDRESRTFDGLGL